METATLVVAIFIPLILCHGAVMYTYEAAL